MSQNANISKGQATKVSTKASTNLDKQPTTTTTTVNTHEKLKATSDQIRLAQLLSNDKNTEDPIISEKVKRVLEIVPLDNREDVLFALSENDNNIEKTVEYLLDNETQNQWKTVGGAGTSGSGNSGQKNAKKENDINNNSTAPAVEPTQTKANNNESNKVTTNKFQHNKKVSRGGSMSAGRQQNQPQQQQNSRFNNNNRKFIKNETGDQQVSTTINSNEEGNQQIQDESFKNGHRYNNNRSNRGRSFGSSRGNRNEENGGGGGDGSGDKNNNNNLPRSTRGNRQNRNNDNLTDIGTWSNEQAASDRPNKSSRHRRNYNQHQQQYNHNEEWDNKEEEWQGDLSKTQIFTSTIQKQQINQPVVPSNASINPNNSGATNEHQTKIDLDKLLHRDEPQQTSTTTNRSFDSNFPIGHFDAKEASQQIKNAIGIKVGEQQQQQPPNKVIQQPTSNKLPSVKPPPPSTKIPKSAVIMPDGNTNAYNLDVQFGIDFGQEINLDNNNNKKESSIPQQTTTTTTKSNDYLSNDIKRVNTVAPQQQQNVNKQQDLRPHQQQNINPVTPLIQQQQTNEIVNSTKNLDINKNYNEQQQITSKQQQPQQFNNQTNSNIIYNTSIQQQQHANQYKPPTIVQQKQQFTDYNNPPQSINRDNKDVPIHMSPSNLVQKNLLQQAPPPPLPQQNNQQQTPKLPNLTAPPMQPPPGVNVMNNPFLMSMPFVYYDQSKNPQQKYNSVQNMPYFDQNQMELMYSLQSQLATMPPPPPTSAIPQTNANYTMSDTKLNRPDGISGTATTNTQQQQAQSQQQQQQTINFIPNYPYFLQNVYPNMLTIVPNTPQANPQFPNKPYNFNNNANIGYDEHGQTKDYTNYNNPQTQSGGGKTGNIPNLNDLNVNYGKQLDKQQSNTTGGGYHTPPPSQSTYSQNQLASAGGQQAYPPYITQQIIGQHQQGGTPLIMPNMQDNSRGSTNTNKQQQNKSAYQANSWS